MRKLERYRIVNAGFFVLVILAKDYSIAYWSVIAALILMTVASAWMVLAKRVAEISVDEIAVIKSRWDLVLDVAFDLFVIAFMTVAISPWIAAWYAILNAHAWMMLPTTFYRNLK